MYRNGMKVNSRVIITVTAIVLFAVAVLFTVFIFLSDDKSGTIIEKICEKLEDVDIEEVEERAKRGYEYHELNSGKRFSDWRSCTSIFMLTKRLRKWNDANKSFTV